MRGSTIWENTGSKESRKIINSLILTSNTLKLETFPKSSKRNKLLSSKLESRLSSI